MSDFYNHLARANVYRCNIQYTMPFLYITFTTLGYYDWISCWRGKIYAPAWLWPTGPTQYAALLHTT